MKEQGPNPCSLFYHAAFSFATAITLTNGVPIESVSKMFGHKKLQTTQHYANILDKKVSIDMQTLKVKMKAVLPIPKTATVV